MGGYSPRGGNAIMPNRNNRHIYEYTTPDMSSDITKQQNISQCIYFLQFEKPYIPCGMWTQL